MSFLFLAILGSANANDDLSSNKVGVDFTNPASNHTSVFKLFYICKVWNTFKVNWHYLPLCFEFLSESERQRYFFELQSFPHSKLRARQPIQTYFSIPLNSNYWIAILTGWIKHMSDSFWSFPSIRITTWIAKNGMKWTLPLKSFRKPLLQLHPICWSFKTISSCYIHPNHLVSFYIILSVACFSSIDSCCKIHGVLARETAYDDSLSTAVPRVPNLDFWNPLDQKIRRISTIQWWSWNLESDMIWLYTIQLKLRKYTFNIISHNS